MARSSAQHLATEELLAVALMAAAAAAVAVAASHLVARQLVREQQVAVVVAVAVGLRQRPSLPWSKMGLLRKA
jgi:hypothetical protein